MRKTLLAIGALSSSGVMAAPVELYRAYSQSATDHFYTASLDELLGAVHGSYVYEGVAGKCLPTQEPNTIPLFRLWAGGKIGDHFYTASSQERDLAAAHGVYTYEGVACYVYGQQQPGTCPLYRMSSGTNHFYTQSWGEVLSASRGFTYEGVAGYLYPAAASCPN